MPSGRAAGSIALWFPSWVGVSSVFHSSGMPLIIAKMPPPWLSGWKKPVPVSVTAAGQALLIPYLFRICAILAAFQMVFLIALEGLSWRLMGVYSQPPESQKNNSGFYASAREVGHPINR